ncbi:hypothetical protein BDZ97DRAFT_1051936 [Flammula alnicola]|nr:hypothetical protein BDZ97DRAFT_1051936 [Flammula alnicola]
MSTSPHLDLDNTLGAAFLGNIIAGVLYGITCLQTYVYYKKSQGDHISFRVLIYALWVLDTFHLALVTHALYFYLIKSYSNPLALLSPNWSIISQVFVTCVSDLVVRAIYGRRVWMISHNIFVSVLVSITSAAAFGEPFKIVTMLCLTNYVSRRRNCFRSPGVSIRMQSSLQPPRVKNFLLYSFLEKTFANFSHISYLIYIALGSAVAADILIATSLCISLSRSRTGFKKTDSMVTALMLYAINSSVLTTVCSAACFITYTIWPAQFTFIGIYFCLSKLFLNSLLAMLNGRKALKRRVNVLSDSPFHFSNASTRPAEFVTSFLSNKEAYPMESAPPSPMVINVNTQAETRVVGDL